MRPAVPWEAGGYGQRWLSAADPRAPELSAVHGGVVRLRWHVHGTVSRVEGGEGGRCVMSV